MLNFAKKAILLTLVAFLAVSFFACGNSGEPAEQSQPDINSNASSVPESSDIEQPLELPDVSYSYSEPSYTYNDSPLPEVPFAGIYNARSLKGYCTQSPNEKLYPASLTKMVTALTALKYCSADAVFKVGTELNLVNEGSSIMWLGQGMRISLEQLIYGLMLPSGNDAAYTIAVNVARSIQGNEQLSDKDAVAAFAKLMNDFCNEIGAADSHFVNPDGWDNENHYTTVKDIALIYSLGVKNNITSTAMATKEISFKTESGHKFNLTNSNLFLNEESKFFRQDIVGGKTGTTDLAGACLVTVLSIENDNYILITAKCADNTSRYISTEALIEMAYRYHYAEEIYNPATQAGK